MKRAALAAALLVLAGGASAESCRPVEVANLAMVPATVDQPVVQATLAGRPVLLGLDTGAESSMLGGEAVSGLNLRVMRAGHPLLVGADGAVFSDYALVPSVWLGAAQGGATNFVSIPQWHLADARVLGLIGADLLARWDVELDLAAQRILLYRAVHCAGALLPFGGPVYSLAMAPGTARIVVTLNVDGRAVRALLDTGASRSSLTLPAARLLFGLVPGGAAAAPATVTPDGGRLATWRHRFGSLDLAGLRLADPEIDIIDRPGIAHQPADHDLVLGLTELRRLHLYLASGQRRLYLTSSGL
jgi:hypothetical protein